MPYVGAALAATDHTEDGVAIAAEACLEPVEATAPTKIKLRLDNGWIFPRSYLRFPKGLFKHRRSGKGITGLMYGLDRQ